MAEPLNIFLALLGGILPALVWLLFWLREDADHPEPRALVAGLFLGGAAAVVPTYLTQELLRLVFNLSIDNHLVVTVLAWAASEEIIKFLIVAALALRTRYFDEPLDAMIYLITVALGFAAAENALFVLNVMQDPNSLAVDLWRNGNFRFIGATIAHTVSSATVGIAIALAFCERRGKQILALLAGLAVATVLHALFNYLIINSTGAEVMKIFILFWALAIVIIYLFEKVKTLVCHIYLD
ncbi:MAG: PrsW family glutamic-type intramembrane protease [Patescibacteria group bacterium]